MEQTSIDLLTRIADALERLAPPPLAALDLSVADAFVWHPVPGSRDIADEAFRFAD